MPRIVLFEIDAITHPTQDDSNATPQLLYPETTHRVWEELVAQNPYNKIILISDKYSEEAIESLVPAKLKVHLSHKKDWSNLGIDHKDDPVVEVISLGRPFKRADLTNRIKKAQQIYREDYIGIHVDDRVRQTLDKVIPIHIPSMEISGGKRPLSNTFLLTTLLPDEKILSLKDNIELGMKQIGRVENVFLFNEALREHFSVEELQELNELARYAKLTTNETKPVSSESFEQLEPIENTRILVTGNVVPVPAKPFEQLDQLDQLEEKYTVKFDNFITTHWCSKIETNKISNIFKDKKSRHVLFTPSPSIENGKLNKIYTIAKNNPNKAVELSLIFETFENQNPNWFETYLRRYFIFGSDSVQLTNETNKQTQNYFRSLAIVIAEALQMPKEGIIQMENNASVAAKASPYVP